MIDNQREDKDKEIDAHLALTQREFGQRDWIVRVKESGAANEELQAFMLHTAARSALCVAMGSVARMSKYIREAPSELVGLRERIAKMIDAMYEVHDYLEEKGVKDDFPRNNT